MNPLGYAARRVMEFIAHGDMLADYDDPPARPLSRAELHAVNSPCGITLAELAGEAVVLDRLAGLTATLGPWEAARVLFASPGTPRPPRHPSIGSHTRKGPCTALRATQTPEQMRVGMEPHRPPSIGRSQAK